MSLYNKDNRHCNSGLLHFRGRAIEVPEYKNWKPSIHIKIENNVLIFPCDESDKKYFCIYFGEIVYYSLMSNNGYIILDLKSDDFIVDKTKDIMFGNKYFLNELLWNRIDIKYTYDSIILHKNE